MRIFNKKTCKTYKFTLLILLSIIFCQSVSSQFYWQKLYYPLLNGTEEIFETCEADGTNFFAVGFTATPTRSVYLLKLNYLGDTIWTRVFNIQEAYDIVATNDSGCIFTGYSGSGFACKTNANGEIVWYINFPGGLNDIEKTTDGNYILCGGKLNGFNLIGYVVKINPDGGIIWEKEYNFGNDVRFFRIIPDFTNGFLITGEKYVLNKINSFFLKINDTGAVIWNKNYLLNFSSSLLDFCVTNNNYITVGTTNLDPVETDSFRVYICKTNLTGDTLKTKVLNASNYESYPAIVKLNNNKFVISILGNNKSRVIVVDSNLTIKNTLSLQNNGFFTRIFSVMKAPNSFIDDLISCGWSNYDAYIAKIDSSLNPPPPIGIANNTILLSDYSLFQNYPNPFNSETLIKFTINKASKVKVEVYDILGRKIGTLTEKNLRAGNYEHIWNTSDISSGIYFITMYINNIYSQTIKTLLIK